MMKRVSDSNVMYTERGKHHFGFDPYNSAMACLVWVHVMENLYTDIEACATESDLDRTLDIPTVYAPIRTPKGVLRVDPSGWPEGTERWALGAPKTDSEYLGWLATLSLPVSHNC